MLWTSFMEKFTDLNLGSFLLNVDLREISKRESKSKML